MGVVGAIIGWVYDAPWAVPIIVAVSDVFDAQMTQRPYKSAWDLKQSLNYIKTDSGRHFDPDCAHAFLRRLDEVMQIMQEYSDNQTPKR